MRVSGIILLYKNCLLVLYRLPKWHNGKESPCQCRRLKRYRFNPWGRKIPWRREWQPTPMFLPEKFHGQRSPAGYRPWGHKESDMTERLSLSLSTWKAWRRSRGRWKGEPHCICPSLSALGRFQAASTPRLQLPPHGLPMVSTSTRRPPVLVASNATPWPLQPQGYGKTAWCP